MTIADAQSTDFDVSRVGADGLCFRMTVRGGANNGAYFEQRAMTREAQLELASALITSGLGVLNAMRGGL